jgi:hypothetical protein
MSATTKARMRETAVRMLRYVSDHPRRSIKPLLCPENGPLFAAMDEDVREREVAYWREQVERYS